MSLEFKIIILISIIIIVYFIYSYLKEKKRIKDIKNYCFKKNIYFSEFITNSTLTKNAYNLKTIDRGVDPSIENIMKIEKKELVITIFDFNYYTEQDVTRSVKSGTKYKDRKIINSYIHYETVCIINKPNIVFPRLFLRDKKAISDPHTTFPAFKQNIIIPGDKNFSSNFILHGTPDEDVKDFFATEIKNTFIINHVEGYRYETNQDCFAVSIAKILDIKGRLELLDKSLTIYKEIEFTRKLPSN